MGISEKKQALSQGRISPAKTPRSDKPELTGEKEKMDTSIFGGKEYLEAGTFKYKLRDPKLFSTTGLGEEKIRNLGEKIFKGSGSYIKKSDLREIRRQLDLGKWGKFRNMSEKEREEAKRLIDKGILRK